MDKKCQVGKKKNYTALCEFHFTSNMWEQTRVDGTKKFKCTAIPTIFGELAQKISKKAGIKRNKIEKQSPTILTTTKSDGTVTISIENPEEGLCQSVLVDIEQTRNTQQITVKTESNQNTINSNRIEEYSLATSTEHSDSVKESITNPKQQCQLENLSSDIEEQTAQLNMFWLEDLRKIASKTYFQYYVPNIVY